MKRLLKPRYVDVTWACLAQGADDNTQAALERIEHMAAQINSFRGTIVSY